MLGCYILEKLFITEGAGLPECLYQMVKCFLLLRNMICSDRFIKDTEGLSANKLISKLTNSIPKNEILNQVDDWVFVKVHEIMKLGNTIGNIACNYNHWVRLECKCLNAI